MTNTNIFLEKSFSEHPKMLVRDGVKLLYQAQFGGGHLISDPAVTLSRLKNEYDETAFDPKMPLYEQIGENAVRVHIGAVKNSLAPETLNNLFVLSATEFSGTVESFENSLSALYSFFPKEDVDTYLASYKSEGHPPVSHTETYRENYSPAYRIISAKYAKYLPLFMEIDSKKPNLVGIDGRCASGKTTLSGVLEKIYDCNMFHADDYFLPPEMRTDERLSQPGGNMHRERLYEEVLKSVSQKRDTVYRKFFCHNLTFSDNITVPYKPLTFVEGSYSLHPDLRDTYDFTVFLDIDEQTQQQRLLLREGAEYLKVFNAKWIPLEEKYFSAFNIPENCDMVIK